MIFALVKGVDVAVRRVFDAALSLVDMVDIDGLIGRQG